MNRTKISNVCCKSNVYQPSFNIFNGQEYKSFEQHLCQKESGPESEQGHNEESLISQVYASYRLTKSNYRSFREIDRIFSRYILPRLGDLQIEDVDRAAVTRLLDEIAHTPRGYTPAMARAVAAQLSAFFGWAIARIPSLHANPCWLAERPRKPRPRTRILTDQELAVLWEVLGEERFPWSVAVKLILLTGQRRGEVFNADWRELNFEQRIWTIPASRTKNSRDHRVPLAHSVVRILEQIPGHRSGKVFPSRLDPARGASGFSKALRRINRAVGDRTGADQDFTLQDLRRTVATGLQRLGTKIEVTEAVLNHVSGTRDGIVGVYQLHQYDSEKKGALQAWSRFVHSLTGASVRDELPELIRCP